MRKLLAISRRAASDSAEFIQTFAYETDDAGATVASALRDLDERVGLVDVDGNPAEPIRWECSCLQKKCGACAMVIDGVPRLACDARLVGFKREVIRIEPLRTFPVVADLIVDRHAVFAALEELQVWHDAAVELPVRRSPEAYEASRCLQCGCCLEVCPNFNLENGFAGMAGMVPLARLLVESGPAECSRLAEAYRDFIHGGCGTSLACRDICPAGIDLAHLMSRSNAAAVWGRP